MGKRSREKACHAPEGHHHKCSRHASDRSKQAAKHKEDHHDHEHEHHHRSIGSIQTFHTSASHHDMLSYYRKHQVLHIRGCRPESVNGSHFGLGALQTLHSAARDIINKTFTIETADSSELGWSTFSSDDILDPKGAPPGAWYTSFIAQGESDQSASEKDALAQFRTSLPLTDLSSVIGSEVSMENTEPVWVFLGRNSSHDAMLVGRPEHTDDVSHDGTWHYQVKGSKIWYLRPAESPEWGHDPLIVTNKDSLKKNSSPEISFPDGINRLRLVVNEGDVIVLNTRLWWHQTRIPFTTRRGLSISYARDFFAEDLRLCGRSGHETGAYAGKDEIGTTYENIDGLYASRVVKAGEIVLTEAELPNCALPRSEDPTCAIAWLEDGSGALVALKDLSAGDWLTVAPSDDEDEDDGEEEDESDCCDISDCEC